MSKLMPFLTGFTVKPLFISELGFVTFTDGTNNVQPNQTQCEAYGYTYNKADGTCSMFRFNTNLNRGFSNENNKTYGAGNSTETGTNNTLIMGESNSVKGFSRNSIITGSNNEIANSVNNANVSGTKGEATADNSIVLGGNADTDFLGKRQSIQLLYGVQTVTSGTVDSYLNNVTDSYFEIPINTVMYFHADIVAVRVGGTGAGLLGDYASFVERGVILNRGGTLSINRERDAIKSNGTVTLWRPTSAVDGTHFLIDIRGAANVTIEWSATITFTQIKTGVPLINP
tara:strand:- start:1750 stop:2607 length:858 start_codon:yes stop_codon:yes gene_type:complete